MLSGWYANVFYYSHRRSFICVPGLAWSQSIILSLIYFDRITMQNFQTNLCAYFSPGSYLLVSGHHAENENEEKIWVKILKILQFVPQTASSIMAVGLPRLYNHFYIYMWTSSFLSIFVNNYLIKLFFKTKLTPKYVKLIRCVIFPNLNISF